MADVKASERTYSSPLRAQQADATRRAVLAAARELFTAQGYGATTIDQIAARAGVSKPTVFSAVGNKQTVLSAVRDVAMAGDDEKLSMVERPLAEQIRQEPDPHRAVELLAGLFTRIAPGRWTPPPACPPGPPAATPGSTRSCAEPPTPASQARASCGRPARSS